MNQLAGALRQKTSGTNLIIVRHGQTDLNDKDRIRGWHDVPLNEEGLKQAEELGEELANKNLDVIVTSDFQRASKTAEIISQKAQVPVIPMPELRPWNVGEHTGKESKLVSPELEKHARDLPNKPLPGGESFEQFKQRFLGGIQKIISQFQGKNIAVVTHHRGDMIMSAWEKAGHPPDKNVHIETFLDWEKGIEPGTSRQAKTPQIVDPRQMAKIMQSPQGLAV